MRRVLIVDDDPKVCQTLDRYLSHAGYATASALDGPRALEAVQRFAPDLIVLDVMLPEIDGLAICHSLRGFGGMVQVNEALQTQLGMPVIGQEVAGDPSGRNAKTVSVMRAESVDIGTAHFGGVDVQESAGGHLGDVDGVLGLHLFSGLVVTFDYPNSRFQLRGGSLPAEGSLAYTADHGVPTIEIDVNGQKMKTDIDSGSPGEVTLPLSVAKSLSLSDEPRVVGRGRTAGGEFDVYGAPLNGEVHVGSMVLMNPRIDFVDIFPIGNLGSRFMRNRIVIFDPSNRRVRFGNP